MSFFSALGGDLKKAFSWLASPKGQAIVAVGEGIAVDFFPAATGIVNIINKWATEAIKTEAIAVAASQADGSGAQKAAILLNTVTPEVLAFAKANGLPEPTGDKLAQINNAIVLAINLLAGTATPSTATPAQ